MIPAGSKSQGSTWIRGRGIAAALLALGAWLCGACPSFAAAVAPCDPATVPELAEWLGAKQDLARAGAPPLAEIQRLNDQEWKARKEAASRIYLEYFGGSLRFEPIEACLERQSDRGNFMATLQAQFYSASIARLRSASGRSIRAFIGLVDQGSRAGAIPLFRLTGQEFGRMDPAPWSAGFHRGTGSIYADFNRIPHEQWLLIFVHELLHSLDDTLAQAVQAYGDPATIGRVSRLALQARSVNDLGPESREELEAWIRAGLDRGLWAEYRAWVASFAIYREGKADGLWPPIDWAETVLRGRPGGERLERYLYDYLDKRSPDPRDGIFATPLVRDALQRVRREYRTGPALPPLGNLAPVRGH